MSLFSRAGILASTSLFSATGRDRFVRPYPGAGAGPSAVIPTPVTALQDALTAIEAHCLSAVATDPSSARSPSLCAVVQRWSFTYGGERSTTLSLSPAILEDAGVVIPQGTNPATGLASTLALDGTVRGLVDLAGGAGLALSEPAWAARLRRVPVLKLSVRRPGAVGDEAYSADSPVFFDAGSGASPRVLFSLSPALPGMATTPVSGPYEACLLILNWG